MFQNYELKNMLIVDNTPTVYSSHFDNGVPITPFFGDDQDRELEALAAYLVTLSESDDLARSNREYFKFEALNKGTSFKDSLHALLKAKGCGV